MRVFLAFLLVMVPPPASVGANVSVTGRQAALQCHVCEMENSFACTQPTTCATGEDFCSTSAIRVFVRHFMMSRQCVSLCPVPVPVPPELAEPPGARGFVLEAPTPLLYVHCCSTNLCNDDRPRLNDTEWAYFSDRAGRARASWGSRAGVLAVLAWPAWP